MKQLSLFNNFQNACSSTYLQMDVMRYMGNKRKLLPFIIPVIENETKEGDLICDLMAGTHCIGYALKNRNRVLSNDVMVSSHVIGKALIENNKYRIDVSEIGKEFVPFYQENKEIKHFSFFEDYYSNTYFSKEQCSDIDSIRYAIDKAANDEYKRSIYLTALIYAMCYSQSSPGHFAQYMPSSHPRIKKLQQINIKEIFVEKLIEVNNVYFSRYENKVMCSDYQVLFEGKEYCDYLSEVKLFYIDPPYTAEQYSRFYHLLETVVKYDYPKLDFKGLYRPDRFKSGFCYRSKVGKEFEFLLEKIANFLKSKIIISYSNTGLIEVEKLKEICKRYFNSVTTKNQLYPHSTQGKGLSNGVSEYLIICKN